MEDPELFSNFCKVLDSNPLNKGDLLGQGSFGKVYKSNYEGEVIALKVLDNYDEYRFRREVLIMRVLEHKNIIKYLGCIIGKKESYILMEYANKGNLKHFLNPDLERNVVKSIILQIVNAMSYIHSFDVIHRDLKPENILIQSSTTGQNTIVIKICDFGLSRPINNSNSGTINNGSKNFLAPEILKYLGIATSCQLSSDLFSFGLLVAYIFKNDHLVADSLRRKNQEPNFDLTVTLLEIYENPTEKFPEFYCSGLTKDIFPEKILIDCLSLEEEKRPTFKDIKEILHQKPSNGKGEE